MIDKIAKVPSWEFCKFWRIIAKYNLHWKLYYAVPKNKSYEVRGTFVQSQASLLVITTHYLSPNYLPFLNFSTFIHKARLSIPTAGDVVSIEYENNLNCLEQILAHLSTQYINDRHKEFVY